MAVVMVVIVLLRAVHAGQVTSYGRALFVGTDGVMAPLPICL